MRGTILAIIAVVLCPPTAAQLVSVHEPGIRVELPTGPASITIPVDNPLGRASKGTLAVSWLDVAGKESPPLQREVLVSRGRSEHVLTLPLDNPSIWTRLRYSLTPDRTTARDFPPRSGIVSLAHVSPGVFEVKVSYTHYTRGGAPFVVQAAATHPVTRQPVSDVQWSGTLEIDDKEVRPSSIRSLGDGFAEIRFDPVAPPAEVVGNAELTITARRGGFEAEATASPNFGPAITALIQSDKPIYQPGQKVGVRAVLTGSDGRAAAGAKMVMKIASDRNDLTHTVEKTASKHGVIHDEWRIPDNAEPDNVRVSLLLPGTEYPSLATHEVRLSRYELPAFTVTVKPDRSYYSLGQDALITVNANYLFGKPVPTGEVRVTLGDEEVAKGTAKEDGTFAAKLDLPRDSISEGQRFHDIAFAAFVKDPSTGRSAQREFRVRVTRDPIHIYPLAVRGLESGQASLYVSASYADGKPAPVTVTWKTGALSGEIRTNRYGVGKGLVPRDFPDHRVVEWHARDSTGLAGDWREQVLQRIPVESVAGSASYRPSPRRVSSTPCDRIR